MLFSNTLAPRSPGAAQAQGADKVQESKGVCEAAGGEPVGVHPSTACCSCLLPFKIIINDLLSLSLFLFFLPLPVQRSAARTQCRCSGLHPCGYWCVREPGGEALLRGAAEAGGRRAGTGSGFCMDFIRSMFPREGAGPRRAAQGRGAVQSLHAGLPRSAASFRFSLFPGKEKKCFFF